jgi:hypothetical protein
MDKQLRVGATAVLTNGQAAEGRCDSCLLSTSSLKGILARDFWPVFFFSSIDHEEEKIVPNIQISFGPVAEYAE